ncbi:hypothetical protein ACTG9Q_30715 [Actinokineospora sp. 24-640]
MGTPLLKVCGATSAEDVGTLAAGGADLVGLWHGVPGGGAELSRERLARLAAAASAARVRPVLVTFLGDPAVIADVLVSAGIEWVQLHAYQSPLVVRELRRLVPRAVVVKVLHISDDECVERRLIPAYERAGTDMFLLDRVDGGRVGSTGLPLDEDRAIAVAARCSAPFLIAGGIRAETRYPRLATEPGFAGVDVDTGARDAAGRFDRAAVEALAAAWTPMEATG